MSKIIENLNPEIASVAEKIGNVLEINQDGIITVPDATEVFATTLPEGLTTVQVEQSIQAVNNWNQGVAAAAVNAIAGEVKDETEIGKNVTAFAYADTICGTSFELALNVNGDDKSEISLTGQTSYNDTTNALFASLASGFATFVKGEGE